MSHSGPDSPRTAPRVRNHRRSHSFSDEKGPGAFVSLGALPKVQRKPLPRKLPAFHFKDDDDDDSPEDDSHPRFARLFVDTQNLAPPYDERVMTNRPSSSPKDELTTSVAVPFPLSSPLSPSPVDTPQLTASTTLRRPTLSRGSSHPILLSNGKPLKSSLKSSPSASSIPDDVRSMHLRVQSAPTTPLLSKNVHFPEKKEDGLESVRVFSLKAKPASLSLGGDDTETETETEPSRFPRFGVNYSGPGRFPTTFDIDYETPEATSIIPTPNPPLHANIHLESIALVRPDAPSSPFAPSSPHITGTILVRNVAYEKHVAVRFTLDDWQTISEVSAHHIISVPALPWETTQGRTLGDAVGIIASASAAPSTWDRFSFNIRLEDHAYKVHQRVLWLVGRYTATGDGGGEWWDNNSGSNYRVGFKLAATNGRDDAGRPVSAPEPMMKATSVEPTARLEFASGFEFPTTSAPLSKGHIPTHTRSIPPPPAIRTPQRQTKLSLLNYAAPSLSPTSPGPRPSRSPLNTPPLSTANAASPFSVPEVRVTPPPSPKDEHGHEPTPPSAMSSWASNPFTFGGNMYSIIGGQPATPSYFEPHSKGITLKWPWGLGSNFNSDVPIGSSGSSSGSGSNSPQHSSPRSISPSASVTPLNSSSGSRHSGSGSSSPNKGIDSDSGQLYDAFVKQWCFAQSPRPSPGHNGFLSADGFTDAVLVG